MATIRLFSKPLGLARVAALGLALICLSATAWAQEKAKPDAAKAAPKGDVVMESMSTPITRGKKITGYEHATVIMWLTTKDHANTVCQYRYQLADAFLSSLHDYPIPVRNKKEARAQAEQRLFDIAVEMFGLRVLKRLRIEWARNMTGGKTTIFGTFTDVQCEEISE